MAGELLNANGGLIDSGKRAVYTIIFKIPPDLPEHMVPMWIEAQVAFTGTALPLMEHRQVVIAKMQPGAPPNGQVGG